MSLAVQQETFVPEIGKYHLVATLARGGMGNVYLAASLGPGGFNKLLAIKELKPELNEEDVYVTMFMEEARLAARLAHPNIVQTIEVASDRGRHYMVMEYLDGRSLHRIAKKMAGDPTFPVGAHLRVIAEALLGLQYAHDLCDFNGEPLNVVHRDMGPLNVFLTFDGQTKVIDFGIAKSIDSGVETKTGILKGRVAYMAPEQAWGGKVDRRADVYACGVMIWEAAAGRRLWKGLTEIEILGKLAREEPPSLLSVCPDAPPELNEICRRALSVKPDSRYATAADLRKDLEAHLNKRNDAPSMREIGAAVALAFTDERRQISAIIESTLAKVRSGPLSGSVPVLDVSNGTGTRSDSGLREGSHDPTSLPAIAASLPPDARFSTGPQRIELTSPGRGLGTGEMVPGWRRHLVTGKGKWAFAATAGAVCAAAIGVGLSTSSGGHPAPSATPLLAGVALPAPTPPSIEPAPAPRARHDQDLVELAIRVSPSSAEISIDGAAVSNNPFHGRYPRDGQMHHLLATAEGCEPKLVDISFANDVAVDLSLDRRPSAAQTRRVQGPAAPLAHSSHVVFDASTPLGATSVVLPSPAPAPVASPIVPKVEVDPAGGRPPLHPIQTNNPYGVQ